MAEDGAKNGFWIHVKRKVDTGDLYFNPITQEKEVLQPNTLWQKERFYYQGQLTTEEYNQFGTFRGKMLKEQDTEKAEDMATRLYEYGAMKFLDMDHDTYRRAKKDEVRMAVDACLHISSWNGQIGDEKIDEKMKGGGEEEEPLGEIMHELRMEDKKKQKGSYYKAPDEE